MREWLEVSDFESIQGLAHKLKGNGGAYGFHHLTDLGASLEEAAKAKDLDSTQQYVEKLAAYLQDVTWKIDPSLG